MSSDQYALREVMHITGLSRATLHAWERRYGVVRPVRCKRGRRTYSENEVYRLQLLKRCVDAGYQIGKLALLDEMELRQRANPAIQVNIDLGISDLIADLDSLDADALGHRLSVQFAALGSITFANCVAIPLMREVGLRVARQELSIAGEHLAGTTVRTILSQSLRFTRHAMADQVVVFATLEGEAHEMPLMIAALYAQNAGLRVLYLGTELPASEIAFACSKTQAPLAVTAVTMMQPTPLKHQLSELRSLLHEDVKLWAGGRALAALQGETLPGISFFNDLSSYNDALQRISSQKNGD